MADRDRAIEGGMKLRAKFEYMNDVMKLAVEESQLQQRETNQMIEQLSAENQGLRKLMNIHREHQDQKHIDEGVRMLSEESTQNKKKDTDAEEEDPLNIEINQALATHEQEIQRTQDDYLLLLREEQDLQFNREIDEHKEIIQRIYDDKLQEK